jgi:hypothetical protein
MQLYSAIFIFWFLWKVNLIFDHYWSADLSCAIRVWTITDILYLLRYLFVAWHIDKRSGKISTILHWEPSASDQWTFSLSSCILHSLVQELLRVILHSKIAFYTLSKNGWISDSRRAVTLVIFEFCCISRDNSRVNYVSKTQLAIITLRILSPVLSFIRAFPGRIVKIRLSFVIFFRWTFGCICLILTGKEINARNYFILVLAWVLSRWLIQTSFGRCNFTTSYNERRVPRS